MKRTDEHAPSRIQPKDYEFVGFAYIGPEPYVDILEQQILRDHQNKTGGTCSTHKHGGSCMVCGASAFYIGVFYHAKSNSYIEVGQECTGKMELAIGNANWDTFKKAARANIEAYAGKQKAFRYLCEKGLQTAWFMWTADANDVPVDERAPIKNYDTGVIEGYHLLPDVVTVRDMVGKLVRYGSISEKAEGFLAGLLKRIEEHPARIAKWAAEKAIAADCPTGRVTVTGTVLKVEERDGFSRFSSSIYKMTVKDATGFVVWTTVPSGMDIPKRGDSVKITVTLTPSDTDKKFGFGKRPAVFMTPEEKKAAKDAYDALGLN